MNDFTNLPKLYTEAQAAEYLEVSLRTVKRLNCHECGHAFEPQSRFARFCSAACRRAHFKAKREQIDVHRYIAENGLPDDPRYPAPALTILTLDELRCLPSETWLAHGSGVYFLWREERLVYIGVSEHVSERVERHGINRYAEPGMILGRPLDFTKATVLMVPWPFCLAVEVAYIEHYRPVENRRR